MKKKFSKILGVGLTLALITSLLLTASPVLAAEVSELDADTSPDEISLEGDYTISFRLNKALLQPDTITVRFPDDTDVSTADVANTTVSATSGIGSAAIDGLKPHGLAGGTVVAVKDDRTVTIPLPTVSDAGSGYVVGDGIGAMAYVQLVIPKVTNPTETGVYTLEVKTTEESDYAESASYDIDAPTVGGFVYVYNPSNILMATYGGSSALNDAYDDNVFENDDFTIKVGPGTYVLDDDIDITGEGLILKSTEGAENTIIDADGNYIEVSGWTLTEGDDVTIDGFTVENGDWVLGVYMADGVTVQNCIVTDDDNGGIYVQDATDAVITGNVIEDSPCGIWLGEADDCEISDNVITGSTTSWYPGSLWIEDGCDGNEITGNTITGNEVPGIVFALTVSDDNLIKGNTISENEADGIYVEGDAPTNLAIVENDILNNEGDGILIDTWSASNYIMFNNIYGNDTDVTTAVANTNARFNWWGSADEDDFEIGDDVDYEPWLTGEWATVVSGLAVAADNVSSLDAKDDAGVKVTGVDDTDASPAKAAIISAAKYIANPEGALDDAIAFYDVFILLETDFDTADVTAKLKFYDSAITTGSTANFWIGDFWAECSDQEARDGIIYVSVSDDTLPALDELEETIFGVQAGEAVTEFGAPALLAPAVGADDVSLTPTFAWGAVADAIGYDFEFADNANFVTPMVKLDGELGRLIVTAYAYVGELPYSTAYYWRVKAVSADAESDWASGVFITMGEPVEPTPPVVIEPYEPPEITIEQPDIIVQSPDVIVPLPDVAAPITPSWIYVIIGVGAVLVIALLVLIVRTRRVA